MRLNWNKIIPITAIVGMIGVFFGIIGGLAFHSTLVAFTGLSVWGLAIVIILGRAMFNFSDN